MAKDWDKMKIIRLQVEEGFLNGLDIEFSPGLNVLIGARGVGKTSVVELLRYVLRLPHLDARRAATSQQHAEAILSGGRASVTVLLEGQLRTTSRAATDPEIVGPFASAPIETPEVLGQNELEGIGLDPRSRLALIDSRMQDDDGASPAATEPLRAHARSLTKQLREVKLQLEGVRQQAFLLPGVITQLEESRRRESELLGRASAEVGALRERLANGSSRIAQRSREREAMLILQSKVTAISQRMAEDADLLAELVEDNGSSGALLADGVRQLLVRLTQAERRALDESRSLLAAVAEGVQLTSLEIADIDNELRPLRVEFENLQTGAGEAAQNTSMLERQVGQIEDIVKRIEPLEERAVLIQRERRTILLEIDRIRERVWSERLQVALSLNTVFKPRIRITLEHLGDHSEYVGRLSSALRGSGLQHNQLAEWLAERVTPQELVEAVEAGDAVRLATVGELTPNRVDKLVTHLAGSDELGAVLTAPIEDFVNYELMVASDYRTSEELSTGQRCALVLPILLADSTKSLILDQPEDHLDNAYLVENTVASLRHRSALAQTIVVTHNANIPVLGEADRVIALESDGRRGYVLSTGSLADDRVVDSITRLMEGGRDAFARRARFYAGGEEL